MEKTTLQERQEKWYQIFSSEWDPIRPTVFRQSLCNKALFENIHVQDKKYYVPKYFILEVNLDLLLDENIERKGYVVDRERILSIAKVYNRLFQFLEENIFHNLVTSAQFTYVILRGNHINFNNARSLPLEIISPLREKNIPENYIFLNLDPHHDKSKIEYTLDELSLIDRELTRQK